MRNLEILVVSFCYPPLSYPRSIQVARLLKFIKRMGISADVVCADQPQHRHDTSIEAHSETIPNRIDRPRFYRSLSRRLLSKISILLRIPVINKVPDAYSSWVNRAQQTAFSFNRSRKTPYDAIVTFGMPMSDHLIGLSLKQQLALPWIAHFSDPWADNPLNRYDALTRYLNCRLESNVITNADRVVFTCEETRRRVMNKYPETWSTKSYVIPHAFDPHAYPHRSESEKGICTVRYIGNFYGRRTPTTLLKALQQIEKTEQAQCANLCFELIGRIPRWFSSIMKTPDLSSISLKTRPTVSYGESLKFMAASDGLLVIDAPATENLFFPSKLADYIGARRPIVGLTPPGASQRIITELGGKSASPDNPREAARTLESFIKTLPLYAHGRSWGNETVRQKYSGVAVAEQFAMLLEEICP